MKAIMVAGILGLVLASCGSREPLEIKQFTVRNIEDDWSQDLLVSGEVKKRLYGAVEQAEREKRKGQYYSARWRAAPSGGPVKVRFQYRQAASGSRVQELVHTVPATEGTGVVEFAIAGDSYLKGGRVLAWRTILSQGGVELGVKKSFLWD